MTADGHGSVLPDPATSLRDHLDRLRTAGELVEITRPVSWNLEMAAIARRCYEVGAPAALFTEVSDAAPGFRVLGAPMGVSAAPHRLARIALALGLPGAAAARSSSRRWRRVAPAPRSRLASWRPHHVRSGCCSGRRST